MGKVKKTAFELEAMIVAEMILMAESYQHSHRGNADRRRLECHGANR
jgi:hypothetical protein